MATPSSILVVDDNPEAREMLGALLSALGVEKVLEVPSAEEALEVLGREAFALIISDYRLEGMDGVQFLDRVRKSGDRTPVILISGAPEQLAMVRAARQDRVDVFPKPFRIAELTGAMDRLLAP